MTGPATASTPDPAQPRRVVVVGAGPAGLTAAARLAAGGVSVSVLEAMPSPAIRN
ncbi:MAG: NAD(P)-binding protein, partial [Brevundimonas sp.]